jgi:DNA (cytosine-5)-methyltransferase 1
VYDPAGVARTLKAEAGGVGAKTGLYAVPVLTPMTTEGVRIRRLTPLECFRLQGFPDEHFHNAKAAGVSDSQLYKQAGNAVTVNVVYEIARRLQND